MPSLEGGFFPVWCRPGLVCGIGRKILPGFTPSLAAMIRLCRDCGRLGSGCYHSVDIHSVWYFDGGYSLPRIYAN